MVPAVLIRKVIAPAWALHERSPYLKWVRALARQDKMDVSVRQEHQLAKLKDLVLHAWRESAYYRARFQEAGFEPGDLKSLEDLRGLPLLSKSDIIAQSDAIISKRADRKYLLPRKTSGSTGVTLHFFTDDREYQFKRAVACYRDQWTGWRIGDWKAMVWGNPSYLDSWRGRVRNYWLERCFSLDTLRMDQSMMEWFAAQILRRKPTMLFGHAHSLYLFANYWQDRGLPNPGFKGILSTAMVLHPFERKLCESVFGCKVFNRYGCEEVSLIASECEAHEGLHINSDSLIVEVLPDDSHAIDKAGPGSVVVTDLCNHAMPFIRYQVGDLAVEKCGACPCGRTYPMLQSITGRVSDYLRTPEGEWISGISLTENFATLIPGVKQLQIIQEGYDLIRLKCVPTDQFDESSHRTIQKLVMERFGPRMHFELERVDRIMPEASGKYRFAIYRPQEKPH